MSDLYRNDYLWNPRTTPDADILRLETALRAVRFDSATSRFDASKLSPRVTPHSVSKVSFAAQFTWPLATAASILLLIGALTLSRAITRPWAVVLMRDNAGWMPDVSTRPTLATGEWIVTDSVSRARLNVGALGKAELGPSSRLRLLRAALTEHRLELAEGTLKARIWAPPRFFLLETPAALAVDLGCAYTMHVDRFGEGYLRVESGEVELVGRKHRVLVPAGNTVHVSENAGPGLPYSDKSSSLFISALTRFEKNPADMTTLNALIDHSGPGAAITLWHLIPRVDASHRLVVAKRLETLAPLPPSVAIDAILKLDSSAMESWKNNMEQQWSSEKVHFWKRWWRAAWRAQGSA